MTNPTIDAIIAKAAEAGVEARYWEKGGKFRLYVDTGRRDAKVFLELDDAEASGAALKVFIDDCGQAPAWYASQKKALQGRFMPLFFAYVVIRYADTAAAPNGYGPDINAMIDEARAFFAARSANAEGE